MGIKMERREQNNFTMFVKEAFWRKIFLGHPHWISDSAFFHKEPLL
jgi:hypothetical protein